MLWRNKEKFDKNNKQQLPGMGNVPVLGNLFKGSQKQDMLTEMLIFIAPRVYRMLKISRESEINLINVLIDNDIISGKDLPNIKKVSTEKNKSQIDAVFELKHNDEDKILDVLVKEQSLEVADLSKFKLLMKLNLFCHPIILT